MFVDSKDINIWTDSNKLANTLMLSQYMALSYLGNDTSKLIVKEQLDSKFIFGSSIYWPLTDEIVRFQRDSTFSDSLFILGHSNEGESASTHYFIADLKNKKNFSCFLKNGLITTTLCKSNEQSSSDTLIQHLSFKNNSAFNAFLLIRNYECWLIDGQNIASSVCIFTEPRANTLIEQCLSIE